MVGSGIVVAIGQSLRKQKAWAWYATVALLVMAFLVAGLPPLWLLDVGRRGTKLTIAFVGSAIAVGAIACAIRACVSEPVRAGSWISTGQTRVDTGRCM